MKKSNSIKKVFFLTILIGTCFTSKAQSLDTKHLRNSMTLLVAQYTNNPTNAHYYANDLHVPSMFDDNSYGNNVLRIDDYYNADNSSKIQQALESKKVAQQILKTILYDEKTRKFSKELMFERGEYTASDLDYKVAMDMSRKEAALKDLGENLMKNIYIQVIDCASYKDMQLETTSETKNIYTDALNSAQMMKLDGHVFLFKLDLDEILNDNSFWDLIDFDNNNNNVRQNFDNYNFHFKQVNSYDFQITESKTVSAVLSALSTLTNVEQSSQYLKSERQLMSSMLNKAVEKSTNVLCASFPNFEIGHTVFATQPIQIKVGRKESVKLNSLYEITENVEGKYDPQHVAWVRVRNVSKNIGKAKGKTKPSVFYKVSGGSIQKGMSAKYVPNRGIALSNGYNMGTSLLSGNFIEYTQFIPIPKTRIGFKVNYGTAKTADSENPLANRDKIFFNYSNFGFDLFLNHTIRLGILNITPKIGLLYAMGNIKTYDEQGTSGKPMSDWSVKEDEIKVETMGYTSGVSIGINFAKNIQLSVRYDYSSPFFTTNKSDISLLYGGTKVEQKFASQGVLGIGLTLIGF